MKALPVLLACLVPTLAFAAPKYPPVNGITLISAEKFQGGVGKGRDISQSVYKNMTSAGVSVSQPLVITTPAEESTATVIRQVDPFTFHATNGSLPKSTYVIKFRLPDGTVQTSQCEAGGKLRIPAN